MDTNTQKKILHQARQSSSLYTMNLKAFNVVKNQNETLWNPQSDRNLPAIVKRHVPTRGSSVKSSITRARPGSLSAKGSGVDIKHGSYARYLEKLKGYPFNSEKMCNEFLDLFEETINNKSNSSLNIVVNKYLKSLFLIRNKFLKLIRNIFSFNLRNQLATIVNRVFKR